MQKRAKWKQKWQKGSKYSDTSQSSQLWTGFLTFIKGIHKQKKIRIEDSVKVPWILLFGNIWEQTDRQTNTQTGKQTQLLKTCKRTMVLEAASHNLNKLWRSLSNLCISKISYTFILQWLDIGKTKTVENWHSWILYHCSHLTLLHPPLEASAQNPPLDRVKNRGSYSLRISVSHTADFLMVKTVYN